MILEQATQEEISRYLENNNGIVLPTGSIEQHGTIGLIGTDAICVREIAKRAAEQTTMLVAPTVTYAPAQFNMNFPGTVSIRAQTFAILIEDIFRALTRQGFGFIYVLNGHGANLAPIRSAVHDLYLDLDDAAPQIHVRNWWDFSSVNKLREKWYGEWEGMHGTPSEIAITQSVTRVVSSSAGPPKAISTQYIYDHSGDFHAPASEHIREFPDGRVGSHSELARPEHGDEFIEVAAVAVSAEFSEFVAIS